jgi:hypothetical protein
MLNQTPTTSDHILALPYRIFKELKTSFVENYPRASHHLAQLSGPTLWPVTDF